MQGFNRISRKTVSSTIFRQGFMVNGTDYSWKSLQKVTRAQQQGTMSKHGRGQVRLPEHNCGVKWVSGDVLEVCNAFGLNDIERKGDDVEGTQISGQRMSMPLDAQQIQG